MKTLSLAALATLGAQALCGQAAAVTGFDAPTGQSYSFENALGYVYEEPGFRFTNSNMVATPSFN
jgi:hypothetical protein